MWGFWKEIVIVLKDIFNWFIRRKRSIKDDIASAVKVNKILETLLKDIKADRATVFQFHNGEHFYTGNSIDKITATHEYAIKGISREQTRSVGLFAAPYRGIISGMLYNETFSIPDVSSFEDYNSRSFLEDRGALSAHLCVMRDFREKPVAFVLIENVKSTGGVTLMGKELIKQATGGIYDILVYGKY